MLVTYQFTAEDPQVKLLGNLNIEDLCVTPEFRGVSWVDT